MLGCLNGGLSLKQLLAEMSSVPVCAPSNMVEKRCADRFNRSSDAAKVCDEEKGREIDRFLLEIRNMRRRFCLLISLCGNSCIIIITSFGGEIRRR